MDRGAWWARVHGVAKELDTNKQLNNNNNLLHWHIFLMSSQDFYFLQLNKLMSFSDTRHILLLCLDHRIGRCCFSWSR